MAVTQVGGISTEFTVTPTITAGAYSAGDQLGGIQTLATLNGQGVATNAACQDKTVSLLTSLTIIDGGNQGAAFVLFFFNASPTLTSSDNDAIAITAAELKSKCVGWIEVLTSDYKTINSMKVACLNMPKAGLALKSNTDNGPLYAVVQVTGTPTFVSTSDLVFKYCFSQDLGDGK